MHEAGLPTQDKPMGGAVQEDGLPTQDKPLHHSRPAPSAAEPTFGAPLPPQPAHVSSPSHPARTPSSSNQDHSSPLAPQPGAKCPAPSIPSSPTAAKPPRTPLPQSTTPLAPSPLGMARRSSSNADLEQYQSPPTPDTAQGRELDGRRHRSSSMRGAGAHLPSYDGSELYSSASLPAAPQDSPLHHQCENSPAQPPLLRTASRLSQDGTLRVASSPAGMGRRKQLHCTEKKLGESSLILENPYIKYSTLGPSMMYGQQEDNQR